jgi:hypothetical protein
MLNFLKSVKVQAQEVVRKVSGPRKQRNPENADLRVFADGSVYPSASLVERFNLEYGPKPTKETPATGFGFDVIDSKEFGNVLETPERCLWISPVPRAEGKIDLFMTVKYDENGIPTGSVLDQGTKTFGTDTLLPLLEEIYGIKLGENRKFVDLKFHGVPGEDGTESPLTLPDGKTVTFVPKSVDRGKKKGTPTVVRRENPSFWCLYPAQSGVNVEESAEPEVPSTAEMAMEDMTQE